MTSLTGQDAAPVLSLLTNGGRLRLSARKSTVLVSHTSTPFSIGQSLNVIAAPMCWLPSVLESARCLTARICPLPVTSPSAVPGFLQHVRELLPS